MRYRYIYKYKTGLTKVKTKLAIAFSVLGLGVGGTIGSLALFGAAHAASSYSLTPWTFVGTAANSLAECGSPTPGTPGGVVSRIDSTTGNPAPSLRLEKNVTTTDCSSAGATINGVTGITLSELNFDYQGYCGAGAPRFNVVATDGSHFLGGCANGTKTDLGGGWTHVVIDPSNPAQAFPTITNGATVTSIDIVFDEQGQTNIDNVSVNGQLVNSVTPVTKDDCKNNGWKNLVDASNNTFKNQGDCVSYVATKGKNTAAGPAATVQTLVSSPTIVSPTNDTTLTSAQLTNIDWTDSTSPYTPIKYQYRAFTDAAYTSLLYDSGPTLTSSEIPTPGSPDTTYYIQVRAIDNQGNMSAWSNDATNPYTFTLVG